MKMPLVRCDVRELRLVSLSLLMIHEHIFLQGSFQWLKLRVKHVNSSEGGRHLWKEGDPAMAWQCHAQRDRRDDCQVAPVSSLSPRAFAFACAFSRRDAQPRGHRWRWVARRLPRHQYAHLCALQTALLVGR